LLDVQASGADGVPLAAPAMNEVISVVSAIL
jgi:hypothetical protein